MTARARARAALVAFALGAAGTASAQTPLLSLPLDCTPGETCMVQNHVDVDPGAGRADFACGAMTYDGHDGTDFRVPPGEDAEVLAAADGVVRAVRDGERERTFRGPLDVAEGRACGNAVVVDHAGGLSTMYCHMARGSVLVAPGDRIARGTPVGAVGASGLTEFRHVHIGVRRDGDWVDPFTGREAGAGCGPGASLWTPEATAALAVAGRTKVLAVGFNDGPVTLPMIEDGATAEAIGTGAAAFVAWGVAIGTEAGDVLTLTLDGPGFDLDDSAAEKRPRAQAMRFVGRSRAPQPGTYTARFSVTRGGRSLAAREATLTVR